MWLPLWQSCLSKICPGGPEYYIESFFSKKMLQQLLLWQFSSSLVRTIKNKVHTIAKKCVNALDFPREPHLRVEAGGGRSTHGPCNPTARPCHSLVKLHHKAGGCRPLEYVASESIKYLGFSSWLRDFGHGSAFGKENVCNVSICDWLISSRVFMVRDFYQMTNYFDSRYFDGIFLFWNLKVIQKSWANISWNF